MQAEAFTRERVPFPLSRRRTTEFHIDPILEALRDLGPAAKVTVETDEEKREWRRLFRTAHKVGVLGWVPYVTVDSSLEPGHVLVTGPSA